MPGIPVHGEVQYRCTFPDRYPPGSLGRKRPSARQGYYPEARSAREAARLALEDEPDETRVDVETFCELKRTADELQTFTREELDP